MTIGELDNPFWSSLQTRHADIALRVDRAARFPAEYAPFLGVENTLIDSSDAIASLLSEEESIYMLGAAPKLPDEWQIETSRPLAQMICEEPLEAVDGPDILPLSELHRGDVLALTARVYPHYFRTRWSWGAISVSIKTANWRQ